MAATPKPLRKEMKKTKIPSKEIAQHNLSKKKHPGKTIGASMRASLHRDKKLGYVK